MTLLRRNDTGSIVYGSLAAGGGWKASECRFEGEPRRLLLKLDFEPGKRFGCPQCGKPCPTHDSSTRRWRHLNFFQYECILEARVPRSHCPEHGVLSVAVPWAREGSGFTLLFEAFVMLLCREMPMAAVADALGEHDTRLWRVAAIMSKRPTRRTRGRKSEGSRLMKPVPGEAIAT